jgi:glycerol-3-phosphate dehydrogenase
MIRDIGRLETGVFDLLVVGGGIYGAWTAYTASLLGLDTALIERDDWASGTSSASSKLIHGGLRYLERLRVGQVHKSLVERKRLARLAPHRVTPLRFAIPLYRGDRVGKWRLRAGLSLYDAIAGAGQPVSRHEYLSAGETARRYPFLAAGGLKGAFTYGDCLTDDSRFTLEVVAAAAGAGAAVANYVTAERLLTAGGRAAGVVAVDRNGGTTMEVRARVVVNATGPWAPSVMDGAAAPGPTRLVKGVHLVLPALPVGDAFLLFTRRDRRVCFVIPWCGRTLLGTTDTDFAGDPAEARVDAADVDYLLTEVRRVLPQVGWDRSSILGGFAGVRALRDAPGQTAESLSREWILESPMPGLLVSTGGKFTSARPDARKIVGRVLGMVGRSGRSADPTSDRGLPWYPAGAPWTDWRAAAAASGVEAGLDPGASEAIVARYGARSQDVFALILERPEWGSRLVPDLPFVRAELVYSSQHEMIVTLEDLLRRRIPLTILSPPDERVAVDAAQLAAGAMGWTDDRRAAEVEAVLEKWRSDAN